MASSEDKKSKRGSGDGVTPPDARSTDRDVGHALRSVYSTTVNEDIPSELLDLLGKLS